MTDMVKVEVAINKCNRGATVNRQGDIKSDNQEHTLEVQFNMQYEGVLSLVEHTARVEIREECRGVNNEQQNGSHLSKEENMRLIEEDPHQRLQLRVGHHYRYRYLPEQEGQEHELACLEQGARDEQVIGG